MSSNKKFQSDRFFSILLEDSTVVQGKYVELAYDGAITKKVFIKTSDKKREFCIRNVSIDVRKVGWEKILKEEINDYLQFLQSQAKLEFPAWLANNGRYADKINAAYTLKDIEGEWKSMKSLFGTFRMAADCGFFTSKKPFEGALNKVVDIQES